MTSISDSDVLFTLHWDHSIRMLSIVDIVLLSLFCMAYKEITYDRNRELCRYFCSKLSDCDFNL